jgi:hypothetical protein
MRDTHEGMPELLSAYEREGSHFATVRVTLSGDSREIEFGVPIAEYRALRLILQTRPFDQLPGLHYRYFLSGSIGRSASKATVGIRIEQGRDGRQTRFEVPLPLAKNLYWFIRLKDFEDASHLHVTQSATSKV